MPTRRCRTWWLKCCSSTPPGTYSPTVQPSSKGNYHSVRVTVTAQSKEHIEAMYTALGKIELVKYVL